MVCENLTFPHELALAVVHDFLRNQGIVHHAVLFHGLEAAALLGTGQLVLQQGALQEMAHFLQRTTQVLLRINKTLLLTVHVNKIHANHRELNLGTSYRVESQAHQRFMRGY